MGCDIHYILERRVGDKWIGLYSSDDLPSKARQALVPKDRNYAAFGQLANVRGKGALYPRFLPHDISELSWHRVSRYGSDGHSHSYLSVGQFCDAMIKAYPDADVSPFRHNFAAYDLFGIDIDEQAEHRVIFFFDN